MFFSGVEIATQSMSFNALKRMEVDKRTMTPKYVGKNHVQQDIDLNPFMLIESEENEDGNSLLIHLVQ